MRAQLLVQLANYIVSSILPSPDPGTHSPTPTDTYVSFTPRHAHATDLHTSSPLMFADADRPAAFLSPEIQSEYEVPISGFYDSIAEQQAYAAGFPTPEGFRIKTRRQTLRRAKDRAPHILSWARARRAEHNGRGLNATGWIAPPSSPRDLTLRARTSSLQGGGMEDGWEDIEVEAPDVTDRRTLLTLAKLASNAYTTPDQDGWYPLDGFNNSIPIGWEPHADGLRGHVFANDDNTTVIISLKGTSAGVLGSGGPTSKNDKFNDNLMFSCCCARVDFSWSTVCDCYDGGYKCRQTCLEDALVEESVYATVGTNLYNNVTYLYPDATIWLVGHSLGGSLASMIGLAFGAPAVGFEAPGDRLPARRLHLPQPPGMPANMTGITHVYHTADPIPMGACTGAYSGCYAAGFALESKCHTGETILYDTVTVKGWSVDVRTHRISEIIARVLGEPWPVDDGDHKEKEDKPKDAHWVINRLRAPFWGWPGRGKDDSDRSNKSDPDPPKPSSPGADKSKDKKWANYVPAAYIDEDCVDCFRWEFVDEE